MLAGCRGEDISFDCEHQQAAFLDAVADEAVEELPMPVGPPFAATMQLREDGLNRLLEYGLGDVPFAGEVPFGILPQGPGTASFTSDTHPTIVLRPVEGCPSCIIYQLDFSVGLSSNETPLSTGSGWAELAIPLELRVDSATGTAVVYADYARLAIDDWYMSVFGFDSERDDSLSGAAQRFLLTEIRGAYGPVPLLTLAPWDLGEGIRLVAQSLVVDTERQQLVFGLASNVPLPSPGLDLAQPAPATPIAVTFETSLMLAITHRLLEREVIPRRYRDDGQPDSAGDYGVTLTTLAPAGPEDLASELRIWRIADGYCGRAAVALPLALSLDPVANKLALAPGPADLIVGHPENQGAGVAAEEDASLVEEHRGVLSMFSSTLSRELADRLRFPEFEVAETRLLFTLTDIAMTTETLAFALDVDVYAAAAD